MQVEGWGPLSPVSVDRVGTFFRQARPQKFDTASMVKTKQSSDPNLLACVLVYLIGKFTVVC